MKKLRKFLGEAKFEFTKAVKELEQLTHLEKEWQTFIKGTKTSQDSTPRDEIKSCDEDLTKVLKGSTLTTLLPSSLAALPRATAPIQAI